MGLLRYLSDKKHFTRKCTVFPNHPWDPKEKSREGVVVWVPATMAELIKSAEELLRCSGSRMLSVDGGRILDVGLISDSQKLYLV